MRKIIGLCFGLWLLAVGTVSAANHAGIVIQNSTGEHITRCVEFEEPSITVETLLDRSGFSIVKKTYDWGSALLWLHDDGTRDPDQGLSNPSGYFWNFFQRTDTGWESASVGISTATAAQGTLVGFAYGAYDAVRLPDKTFAQVAEIVGVAGLVIDHNDGTRKVLVVDFPGETITGLQLLERSGLKLVTQNTVYGTAICAIDGEGQPDNNCFGDPKGRFWSFNILSAQNEWVSSPVGADQAIVRNRDVHGYYFAAYGAPQPPITRNEVLGAPSGVVDWESYAP